jgi:hypothetical protein
VLPRTLGTGKRSCHLPLPELGDARAVCSEKRCEEELLSCRRAAERGGGPAITSPRLSNLRRVEMTRTHCSTLRRSRTSRNRPVRQSCFGKRS